MTNDPRLVDERDLRWEAVESTFRILIFKDTSTKAYDFFGLFSDAVQWASEAAGPLPYRLGIIAERGGEKGVHWLVFVGDDPNTHD